VLSNIEAKIIIKFNKTYEKEKYIIIIEKYNPTILIYIYIYYKIYYKRSLKYLLKNLLLILLKC